MAGAGEQCDFADIARKRMRLFGVHPGLQRLEPARRSRRLNPNPYLRDHLSARRTFTSAQLIAIFLIIATASCGFTFWTDWSLWLVTFLFTAIYLAIILFRVGLLAEFRSGGLPETGMLPGQPDSPDGRYVILAALYKEAGQVPHLVTALDRLVWPEGQKEVHLVCEQDDTETIAAIRAHGLPAGFHLFIASPGWPRTKPRALNQCLAGCRGDYLVIYDAEDRPDPGQLMEAHRTFDVGPAKLVCLQAPLAIDNRNTNWLTAMFALEYDTLFRGILPALASWRAPMPLGGTSNHFKLPFLKRAGGWDAWNVTEDADLGMRLARLGFACSTITRPTYEEAPSRFMPWFRQRTRWLKGWMQTLLVHHRRPVKTLKEMGLRQFLMFQLILTGIVLSVLIHPFFLAIFAMTLADLAAGGSFGMAELALLGTSTFNLAGGYSTYIVLAFAVAATVEPGSRKLLGRRVPQRWLQILTFPAYWVLISIAGWRALWQIVFDPHTWEKTPHGEKGRTINPAASAHSGFLGQNLHIVRNR